MNEDLLNKLTDATNRSKGQTLFLFELVNKDFDKLLDLEEKIKNHFLSVPGDKETAEKHLATEDYESFNGEQKPIGKWFNLDQFRNTNTNDHANN